jgi:hypothetical protein
MLRSVLFAPKYPAEGGKTQLSATTSWNMQCDGWVRSGPLSSEITLAKPSVCGIWQTIFWNGSIKKAVSRTPPVGYSQIAAHGFSTCAVFLLRYLECTIRNPAEAGCVDADTDYARRITSR